VWREIQITTPKLVWVSELDESTARNAKITNKKELTENILIEIFGISLFFLFNIYTIDKL